MTEGPLQQFRIDLLGGLRLHCGDHLVARFQTYKVGALLGYLAYHLDRDITREWLIEMLWQEQSEDRDDRGRNNLSVALSSLRSELKITGDSRQGIITATRHLVRFNGAYATTDVQAFQREIHRANQIPADKIHDAALALQTAVNIYSGELLPGYYEDWIGPERELLREKYIQALRTLVRYHARQSELTRGIEFAQLAVVADPIREESHRDLIKLFLSSGQVSAALQQYRELEQALTEVLGESPDATSRRLLQEIESRKSAVPTAKSDPASGVNKTALQNRSDAAAKPTPSPDRYESNLPVYPTRLFGRESEIQYLTQLLESPDVRLVTIVGLGGLGKTRLAVEAISRMLQPDRSKAHSINSTANPPVSGSTGAIIEEAKRPERIYFISLVHANTPIDLLETIVQTLQLKLDPTEPLFEGLMEAIGTTRLLLILDNFEALVESSSLAISRLLARVPSLKLLITSRQVLRLTNEYIFELYPLVTPKSSIERNRIADCPSVQLFTDRARFAKANFEVDAENEHLLRDLCDRLEGIPLAIELAAARVGLLSLKQITEQLHHRFRLLVSRSQELPERHRTLRATLEWSHGLLEPDVKLFLERASVFRGGWTLDAAQTVCDEPFALDALTRLRECVLIQVVENAEQNRYSLLETVREFAGEHLAPPALDDLSYRHLDYFANWAESLHKRAEQGDMTTLRTLDSENQNMKAALSWGRGMPSSHAIYLSLANALYPYWKSRGHYQEGREALELAEVISDDVSLGRRATALHGAGSLALLQGDRDRAAEILDSAVRLWQLAGDALGEANSLQNLGVLALRRRESDRASDFFQRAMALRTQKGEWVGVADIMVWLGNLAHHGGSLLEARRLYEESLSLYRRNGAFTRCAPVLMNLGTVAHDQGDFERALAFYENCLRIHRQTGNEVGVAKTQNNRGNVLRDLARFEEAQIALEESLDRWRTLETPYEVICASNSLGLVYCEQNEVERARNCFQESGQLASDREDWTGLTYALTGLAWVAMRDSNPKLSVQILVYARQLRAKYSIALPNSDKRDWERILDMARHALPKPDFDNLWSHQLTEEADMEALGVRRLLTSA